MEARMLSLLLDLLDSTHAFVLGTTSRLSAIPPEILRLGRLDSVVDVHLSDADARAKVLEIMLQRFAKVSKPDDIAAIAKKAHGFSAADLQSVCLRAFMEHKGEAGVDEFLRITEEVRPSNLASFQSKIPQVSFADIFGMDETVERVKSLVVEPLLHSQKYQEMRVDPPRGALIHGPPGTGKSMLCCALANELAVNTIWVDASQMRSMIVGESEKAVADLFAQARKSSPCILLFDHIDALAPRRGTSQTSENTSDRIVTSLLVEMDGFSAHAGKSSDVFVLAVSSRPHVVDPALLRPGRLDVHISLGVPDKKQREAILSGYVSRMPAAAAHIGPAAIGNVVSRTGGYTGADLANLCREAALSALRRDIDSDVVTESDFLQCLDARNK
ncbi:AAA-domain-containing protein [Martensiomyces pterosporus]|nr:AAA-domain-containing protein [Martensiomyces pterosporus]